MTISVRLNDKDTDLIKAYAKLNNISVSNLVRNAILEKIEDEFDLTCYEKAMEEFKKNPKTYTIEEVKKELKIDCDCRKPKPGLILKAAQDYNISLEDSWMIGDGANDVGCGKKAGCKTGLIGEENFDQDVTGNSLLDVVEQILGK